VKTQIIQLNNNDDYISVRDKMSWSQTGRNLLVWPEKGRILTRRLDLVLLKRHCATLGAQIALVTTDAEVHFYAEGLGIPVFAGLRDAQEAHWRVSRRRKIRPRRRSPRPDLETLRQQSHPKSPAWMEHPAIRIILFTTSVVALLVLAAFLLPSARLTLTPVVKIQEISIPVSADPSISVLNLTGSLPTYNLSVIVEGRDSIPTSGFVLIPNQVAIGGLQFTNLTDHNISIPSGTVVSTLGTDPVRFVTSQSGEVAAGPGQMVVLPARALEPGTTGNLQESSLVAIEGELGLSLSVINLYPTHGGSDASAPAPTALDITSLHDKLISTLQRAALADMQSTLPEGDTLITPTLQIANILSETSDPAEGEPGDQLSLSLRLEYQAQAVSSETIHSLVIPILDASLPEGYSPVANTLVITRLSAPTLGEDGITHWTIFAQRKLRAEIPENLAINLASGQTTIEAAKRLAAELPLAGNPQIDLIPSWWPRLPFLSMRIQVVTSEVP
jgi:hypothetical protein